MIAVFGKPIDYRDLFAEKPRPTLYKKAADRFMARDQDARRARARAPRTLRAGEIPDDDPRWLMNRPADRIYARP